MVDREGVVKLIDFGLTIPNKPAFCKPGNRTGTTDYLAPELIRRVTTDHRVDLFALGVTAYEMFTNGLPWEKAASLQTLLSHMNTPPRNPRELRPDLDDATVKFLLKAVARDPQRALPDRRRVPRGAAEAVEEVLGLRGERRGLSAAVRQLYAIQNRRDKPGGSPVAAHPLWVADSTASTIAAVSTRRMRGPRPTTSHPAARA